MSFFIMVRDKNKTTLNFHLYVLYVKCRNLQLKKFQIYYLIENKYKKIAVGRMSEEIILPLSQLPILKMRDKP